MKLAQIHIEAGRTIGLPNYSNIKIGASATIELEDGDTVQDATARAIEIVRGLLREAYTDQIAGRHPEDRRDASQAVKRDNASAPQEYPGGADEKFPFKPAAGEL